jgi:hypothetical protein
MPHLFFIETRGLVEIAVPKSFVQLVAHYWLQLVMLSGVLLGAAGYAFGLKGQSRAGAILLRGALLVRIAADGVAALLARTSRRRTSAPWPALALFSVGLALAVFAAPKADGALPAPFEMLDLELARSHARLAVVLAACDDACVRGLYDAIDWDWFFIAGYGLGLAGLSAFTGERAPAARLVARERDREESRARHGRRRRVRRARERRHVALLEPLGSAERLVERDPRGRCAGATFVASCLKWGAALGVALFNVLALVPAAAAGVRRAFQRPAAASRRAES